MGPIRDRKDDFWDDDFWSSGPDSQKYRDEWDAYEKESLRNVERRRTNEAIKTLFGETEKSVKHQTLKLRKILKMASKSLPILPMIVAISIGYNVFFSDDEKEEKTVKKEETHSIVETVKSVIDDVKENEKLKQVVEDAKQKFTSTKKAEVKEEKEKPTPTKENYESDDKYEDLDDKW